MTDNKFSLSQKKILVTGATSGIGKATAKACDASGAEIFYTGRNEERLNALGKDLGGKNMGLAADLTDDESLATLVEAIPTLDGIVLCAGINNVFPVQFATRKKIDSIFETNFFAQLELIRLLLKKKRLNEGASIVAISSIGGIDAFSLGQAAYGASKAALLSWMKFAAKELAVKGIRVNCILPGHIETPMNENMAFTTEQLELYRESIPLKRFGTPEDIANAVIYLLSDASSWMTGSELKIDGGSTL